MTPVTTKYLDTVTWAQTMYSGSVLVYAEEYLDWLQCGKVGEPPATPSTPDIRWDLLRRDLERQLISDAPILPDNDIDQFDVAEVLTKWDWYESVRDDVCRRYDAIKEHMLCVPAGSEQVGYKWFLCRAHKLQSCFAPTPVVYKKRKWSHVQPDCGPITVFTNKVCAVYWAAKCGMHRVNMDPLPHELWKVRYKVIDKPSERGWFMLHQGGFAFGRYRLCDMPVGTVYASAVRPVQRLWAKPVS